MADCVSIDLWMERRKLAALERILRESGTDTQTVMQARFEELYRQYVPSQERTAINMKLEAERLAEEQREAERQVSSAFHITENGVGEFFQVNQDCELLEVACKLRTYLRDGVMAPPERFADLFANRKSITADEFDVLVGVRMENTGKVTGVFDIDFDKSEISAVHIMDGWKTYSMGNVSMAAYHAYRKENLSTDQRWDRFLEKLNGKELTTAGHLSAKDIFFENEISEANGVLGFYLCPDFDEDAVFGTDVCTKEYEGVNAYANYNMASGTIFDTLEVIVYHEDDSEDELKYPLNAAEKEVLLRKMDTYCKEQIGMTLQEYSAQRMAGGPALTIEPIM